MVSGFSYLREAEQHDPDRDVDVIVADVVAEAHLGVGLRHAADDRLDVVALRGAPGLVTYLSGAGEGGEKSSAVGATQNRDTSPPRTSPLCGPLF